MIEKADIFGERRDMDSILQSLSKQVDKLQSNLKICMSGDRNIVAYILYVSFKLARGFGKVSLLHTQPHFK